MAGSSPKIDSRHEIDDIWKQQMKAELRARGWSQYEFARRVGCDQSTISNMLRESTEPGRLQTTSPYAARASALLGILLPFQAAEDPVLDVPSLRELRADDPEGHRDVMALVHRLLAGARARKRTK